MPVKKQTAAEKKAAEEKAKQEAEAKKKVETEKKAAEEKAAKEVEAVGKDDVSRNGQDLEEVTLLKKHFHNGEECGPHTNRKTIPVTKSQKKRLQTWGTAL